MITQECLRLGSWNYIVTLIMIGRWPLLIFRSLGQRSRSQWLEIVKWFPDNSRMLTARIMKLHRYIDHTGRWPLLIFRSLGQRSSSQWLETVKWFPDDNSRIIRPRIMKLHRYIDHDWQMTPIDFQVTRSKVNVTVKKNIFTQWLPLQLTAHMGGMHVLQTALVIFSLANCYKQ